MKRKLNESQTRIFKNTVEKYNSVFPDVRFEKIPMTVAGIGVEDFEYLPRIYLDNLLEWIPKSIKLKSGGTGTFTIFGYRSGYVDIYNEWIKCFKDEVLLNAIFELSIWVIENGYIGNNE